MSQSTRSPIPASPVSGRGGVPVIPRPTPLTRLHYYDGKFLRASDLTLEQEYHRQLVQFADQAGGSGVVHGYDAVWTGGDALALGPGLALDPQGRTLFLPEGVPLSLNQLIESSRGGAVSISGGAPRPIRFAGFAECEALNDGGGVPAADGGVLYLVTLFHAEDLCGTEDVLGRLCADPCAKSIERPYLLEGVLVRAVPITLETALATSARVALTGRHLRSLTAAAYFADERLHGGSLISGDGLRADAWCLGAAAAGGAGVPVGLFSRAGSAIRFFDAWTARRERMEPPNRRYWAGRMAMRPWDVFLAQVLQFQCQLRDCLGERGEPENDPCRPAYGLLRDTAERFTAWLATDDGPPQGRLEEVERLRGQLVDAVSAYTALPRERLLIACGIVELPSAGYLPVVPSATLSVNQQVRRLMGEGVDLRFCTVRPDFVPHALEEAQHMDRISLLAGLDDPNRKPRVDVLVPDGLIDAVPGRVPGQGYVVELELTATLLELFEAPFDETGFEAPAEFELGAASGVRGTPVPAARAAASAAPIRLFGAGRGEAVDDGLAWHFAGGSGSSRALSSGQLSSGFGGAVIVDPIPGRLPAACWLTVSVDRDPFGLDLHGRTRVDGEAVLHHPAIGGEGQLETRTLEVFFHGELQVGERGAGSGGGRIAATVAGRLTLVGHPSTGVPLTRSLAVREEVILERGSDRRVALSIPRLQLFARGRATLAASREWPEPTRARATAALVPMSKVGDAARGVITEEIGLSTRTAIPLYDLGQRENDEVARPDHPAHAASIAALQRLGQALDEGTFVDPRARKLFPPAAPASTDLMVKATRDWVFFHRRRDKVCGLDAAQPTVPARRYRVFHVEVDRHEEQGVLLEILRSGGGLANFQPKVVGTVEYAGGSPAIETPQSALSAAWDGATPDGNRLLLGVIASRGEAAAEGDVLADARLSSLSGIYRRITPLADAAVFEVLDRLPADLPAADVDGVEFYATLRPQVVTECHTAYLLRDTNLTRLLSVHQGIATTGFSQDLFANMGAVVLGAASFVEGTDNPETEGLAAVAAAFRGHVPTIPAGLSPIALSVSQFDRTAAQTAVHLAQSKRLATALGGQLLGSAVRAGGDAVLPFGCPALTLLALVKTDEIPTVPGVLTATALATTPRRAASRRKPKP